MAGIAASWPATGLPACRCWPKGAAIPWPPPRGWTRRELSDSKAAAAIGDAWYDLAKSDDKLKPLYARALHWYRRAVANSTGADQVPWLQRVEQIEGLALPERYFAAVHDPGVSEPLPSFVSMFFRNVAFEPYDCFKFVVPLELKASPWNVLNGSATAIYSKADIVYGKVPTHVPNIPREYQVGVRVSQYYSSTGPFVIGMVGPRGPFAVVVDMPISTEFCTFITLEGVKTPEQNPTLVRYSRQHLMFGDAASAGSDSPQQCHRADQESGSDKVRWRSRQARVAARMDDSQVQRPVAGGPSGLLPRVGLVPGTRRPRAAIEPDWRTAGGSEFAQLSLLAVSLVLRPARHKVQA